MNMQPQVIRHEAMRIAGTRVDTEERIDVYNPYTNKLVGTVSTSRPEHVRAAFAKAKAFSAFSTVSLPTAGEPNADRHKGAPRASAPTFKPKVRGDERQCRLGDQGRGPGHHLAVHLRRARTAHRELMLVGASRACTIDGEIAGWMSLFLSWHKCEVPTVLSNVRFQG
jgi:hypothetical protein